jgi:ABC transport system ATP-binding/permease protein
LSTFISPCSDLYKLFDKIIILDKGGYQIYYGNPNEAIIYFKRLSQHANPEEDQCTKCGNINTEQVLQIVEAKIVDERGKLTQTRKVSPEEWYTSFREKLSRKIAVDEITKEELPDSYYSIPGLLKQIKIFFLRDLLSKLANKQYLVISIGGAPVLALILGYFTRYIKEDRYIFSQNENLPAYLFMCVITALFLGLMLSAEEIIRDRKILKRESFLNLSWFSYINSKVIILFTIFGDSVIVFHTGR